MARRFPFRLFPLAGIALAALILAPAVSRAQVVVKVSDTVNFRLGFQLQGWAEWLQDQTSKGYQQNFKIRRVRLILAGQVAKNVTFFFQTDNPNMGATVGTATKALNSGFLVQDAFGEWHPFSNDMFILDFGKMLVPFTRNSLQSTSSHLALDGGIWTFLQSAPLQSDAGRDLGLQFKSYLVGDHLEIRAGVFDGLRLPAIATAAGSRNPYRFVGRIVYNVFDTEKGYVPVGTNLGKKRILAFGAGYDHQGGIDFPSTATTAEGKGYNAYGGDIMLDWPVGAGDMKNGMSAITAHADYIHYDGGCGITPAGARATNCLLPTLFKQQELFTDLGFYFKPLEIQPFIRFETENFKEAIDHGRNIRRYMGGFNYYVAQQNMKITAAFERIVPASAPATAQTKNTNHVVVQLQFYYF
ncbi:MAG: OprO/OprP family phosphate-selective porin [Acidobacteriota bacterium]|nr:OprO/OprP family phosphate-selective porin [Acidobacteriota bacterium]